MHRCVYVVTAEIAENEPLTTEEIAERSDTIAAVTDHALRPHREGPSARNHPFWDWYVIGGRWYGGLISDHDVGYHDRYADIVDRYTVATVGDYLGQGECSLPSLILRDGARLDWETYFMESISEPKLTRRRQDIREFLSEVDPRRLIVQVDCHY